MRRLLAIAAGVVALASAAAPARAQTPDPGAIAARATLDPGTARLGERVRYSGVVVLPPGAGTARWLPPDADPDLTWGALAPRRVRPRAAAGTARETLAVTATLQAFRTGTIVLPGLRFQITEGGRTETRRLPNVTLVVTPVLTAADSNAELRPPRGPIAAPWWERVPWAWVAGALALIAAAILAWRAWRRRRRAAPTASPATLDPAARALAELAALRALALPAHGRFGEHAFQLTAIVRRFLEATTTASRPGLTSSELVRALERTRVREDDRRTLASLLRVWDRIKFARAATTAEEAARAEQTAESFVRQVARATATASEAEAAGEAA